MPRKSLVRAIVFIGVFIALEILLTRPFRMMGSVVTFGFVSMALAGSILGPLGAGVAAMLSDLVGFFAFPQGQAYFIGFALTGVARAVLYGLFYYKKPRAFLPKFDSDGQITPRARRRAALKTLIKAAACSLTIFLLNAFTIPYWYTIIAAGTYWTWFGTLVWQYAIGCGVQTVTLFLLFGLMDGFIRKYEI
jgi:ECF transporter S component (folate family)